MKLLGIDVGGTFTDSIIADPETGEVWTYKVPTTVSNPCEGVIRGVKELCQRIGIALSDLSYILHGTTTGTNSILEYDGAKTGMITTKGYRDIIHIARHQRPQNYSILQEVPWQEKPLVPRRYRKVVSERITPPFGDILVPLDEKEVRKVCRELKADGVDSIVVCFLFSYLNDLHEKRAAQLIAEEYPEAYITTSSAICPQFREYERFTTACLNGFVGPKVKKYVDDLSGLFDRSGAKAELHVMRSNGGVSTASMVSKEPVTTLLSGPAAGVIGGQWAGKRSGYGNLITFDVGGTSADIGIITPEGIVESTARDTWISGYPLMLPMIDVHTIGAGGGSIAYVDRGGAFRVGPKSAGAEPGPACYDKGGDSPTVTDANLVLGRLHPNYFLGGRMPIYPSPAGRVIQKLADRLKIDFFEAAEGILAILNHNMAHAIRSKTIAKGYDPRKFTLVAFGGAGPLHAAETAQILGIQKVLIPQYPGITSAIGLLATDLKYDVMKTEFMTSDAINFQRLRADFKSLEESILFQLRQDGMVEAKILLVRTIDCRYRGQGYELRVSVDEESLSDSAFGNFLGRFHEAHKLEYGHLFPSNTVEIVNIRVTGIGEMPKLHHIECKYGSSGDSALLDKRETHFRVDGKLTKLTTEFYNRFALPIGAKISGPAILLQEDTTSILPPGTTGTVQDMGDILIEIKS